MSVVRKANVVHTDLNPTVGNAFKFKIIIWRQLVVTTYHQLDNGVMVAPAVWHGQDSVRFRVVPHCIFAMR